MENFTNKIINITELPKFEQVSFIALHKKYKNVIFFNLILLFLVIASVLGVLIIAKQEILSNSFFLILGLVLPIVLLIVVVISLVSFKKRGYAFREHDVLFKQGLISEITTIIPYSRVQHVAVHQGFISRKLGLAAIEIFTAGGNGSDIEIPGILLDDAEKIKQLLLSKINLSKPDTENTSKANNTMIENDEV